MASTRNKNTKEDYLLEQKMNHGRQTYIHYTNSSSGKAYDDKLFLFGSNPSRLPRETLSKNPVDTESQLFGIGSTNLVVEKTPVKPLPNTLDYVSYFDRVPMVLPEPMVVYENQRAGYLP
tara:strand:+ start:223 stop:582 length:360 start_codon:yes stop_codon:yes gene_type:complete